MRGHRCAAATDRYATVSVPACIAGARRKTTFDPQSKLRPSEFEAGRLGLASSAFAIAALPPT